MDRHGDGHTKEKDFYCTKDKLYDAFIMEAIEDFHIIGFNTLDKEQDWDGCIVTGELIIFSSNDVQMLQTKGGKRTCHYHLPIRSY